MAVHGRYGKPCPDCGTPVQRIVYAANEANYCPRCQTGGKLLADRALSQLLKGDWPKTLEELEERKGKIPTLSPGERGGVRGASHQRHSSHARAPRDIDDAEKTPLAPYSQPTAVLGTKFRRTASNWRLHRGLLL
jgi:Zn-finger nucleic acid-binding protein